jgi:dCTP deaminase
MILGNSEIIHRSLQEGLIEPFLPARVQPASYDVSITGPFLRPFTGQEITPFETEIRYDSIDTPTYRLRPGKFILAQTREKVNLPNDLTARVDGRSTLGRLGVTVHITAGFVDPGFSGTITLEIANLGAQQVTLKSGQQLAQLVFEVVTGCTQGYTGKYQGQNNTQGAKIEGK